MANSQSSDAPDEPQGVYHTSDANSAHMLKALLADYGITAHVVGDASLIASAEFGMGRGAISVVVNSRDFTVARGISTAFQRHLFGTSPDPDSTLESEPQAQWSDWPACRHCGKLRQTRCPICRTAGSEFHLADPGPLRVQSAVSLICPICDDPFEPKFYRTCSWCGHEHNDGLPFDETVINAEENDRSVMVSAALLAIFLIGLFYLLYTFRL
jgi:hypothetical protein